MPGVTKVEENWKDIAGYEGVYQVSDMGGVKRLAGSYNCNTTRYLKCSPDAYGYPCVTLHSDGSGRGRKVHHLVLEAFVGTRPAGQQGAHWDGDRANNRLPNLRWTTASDNEKDKFRHGTSTCLKPCEGHKFTNLKNDEVHTIRWLKGRMDAVVVADLFRVTRGIVYGIWYRLTWKTLPELCSGGIPPATPQKLSVDSARAIKMLKGVITARVLGIIFGVSRTNINMIWQGRIWKTA